MLKTIKRTKQLKLDELIKYCRDNGIKNKSFYTVKKEDIGLNEHGKLIRVPKEVKFDNNGRIILWGYLDLEELFEIEVKEKITKDTEFESTVTVLRNKFGLNCISYNNNLTTNIKKTIENFEKKDYKPLSIYALIDDKLELIWKAQDNERK